jgi:hypothetical protein
VSGENLNPWDRQPNETRQAYAAFRAYLNTPSPERSVERVSSEIGKQASNLYRWKSKWDWEDRASAWNRLQALRAQARDDRERTEIRLEELRQEQERLQRELNEEE